MSYQSESVSLNWELPLLPHPPWVMKRAKRQLSFWWKTLILIGNYGMQYKLVNSVHALPLLWGWQFCRVCVPAVVRRGSQKGHRWRPSFCLCWTISSCCELSDSAWCVTRQMKRLGWTVGCPQSGSQRGTKMNMTSIVLSDELSGFNQAINSHVWGKAGC